ncbi:uncharacterized protein Z520_01188 [Fonsecaea multimorphosa CBS 102226]|uniref:Heterokaryon incompatibility domain-containing protein n=1 Tax=Fonsecaea multimorphosa CBS 102226 TaxID=1442371 RepID=A0A0D2K9I3_9EURO|nr:uncharacterized protein Z520_01188 [Fonsecaea multimorphosa CBS 102226]KIY02723.1 hypothetical protein Z520_01188 [Fonsecaea multimorphosa CBS 102226]OAL31584.1 hypothetical protein AYO22_01176 [Fonsecaea multimorphosa]
MATIFQDARLSTSIARKIYSSLPSASSTRLLQLEPGSYNDRLEASLVVVDIESPLCSEYECISYTWGDETSPNSINVDGNEVPLRLNLEQALRRFRSATKSRLLWVDAISIRQDDADEKAQQVTMIGDVFQNATRVLAWLGEHADSSENLFDISEEAATSLFDRDRAQFRQKYDTLARFMDRRYWHRTWIVAEIVCARELVICCGPDRIAWSHLLKYKFTDVMRFDQGWTRRLTKLDDARQAHRFAHSNHPSHISDVEWEGHRELQGYLYATENTECLEPRDTIFSLRAILHSTSMRNAIRVDYTIPVPELCAATLKAALVSYDSSQNNIAEFLLLSYQLDKSLAMTLPKRLQLIDLLLDDPEGFEPPALAIVSDILSDGAAEKFFGIEYEPYDEEWNWEQKRDHVLSWRDKARRTGKWSATSSCNDSTGSRLR